MLNAYIRAFFPFQYHTQKHPLKLTRQEATYTVFEAVGHKLSGITRSRILNCFKNLLNLPTCILTLIIYLVIITSSFVNASLFPKKGGINIVVCFVSKRCCIVNPLSTSKASPGFFVIFYIDQIYLHHLCCLQISQKKHEAPFGFITIKHFLEQWVLYD